MKWLRRKQIVSFAAVFLGCVCFCAAGFARDVAIRKQPKAPSQESVAPVALENESQVPTTPAVVKAKRWTWTLPSPSQVEQQESAPPPEALAIFERISEEKAAGKEKPEPPPVSSVSKKEEPEENQPETPSPLSEEEKAAREKEKEHYLRQKAFLEELQADAEGFREKLERIKDEEKKEIEIQKFRTSRAQKINAFLAVEKPSNDEAAHPPPSSGSE